MDFPDFALQLATQNEKVPLIRVPLLALDPGHTTGWCAFIGYELIDCGEIDTSDLKLATKNIQALIDKIDPHEVVYESYRIYKWKAKHHIGSENLTSQVIGCIKTICTIHTVEWTDQPPHIAKGFCTDKKLKEWGLWQSGQKHARDAIRHACYYILFGDVKVPRGGGKSSTVG